MHVIFRGSSFILKGNWSLNNLLYLYLSLFDLEGPRLTGGSEMRNNFKIHIYYTSDAQGKKKEDKGSAFVY